MSIAFKKSSNNKYLKRQLANDNQTMEVVEVNELNEASIFPDHTFHLMKGQMQALAGEDVTMMRCEAKTSYEEIGAISVEDLQAELFPVEEENS